MYNVHELRKGTGRKKVKWVTFNFMLTLRTPHNLSGAVLGLDFSTDSFI